MRANLLPNNNGIEISQPLILPSMILTYIMLSNMSVIITTKACEVTIYSDLFSKMTDTLICRMSSYIIDVGH